LPQIKSWELRVDIKTLPAFDLSYAERLHFNDLISYIELPMTSLPAQLAHVTLSNVILTPESLTSREPYFMPRLTTLQLKSTTIFGYLRQYFTTPKLKVLCLEKITFYTENTGIDSAPISKTDMLPSDIPFFRSMQSLERLSIRQMQVSAALAVDLRYCPDLRELDLSWCLAEDFLSSWMEALNDTNSFPALKSIHVDYSWSKNLPVSFSDFAKVCVAQRAGMIVFGNGSCNPRRVK
jgi:hypothetical protein